MRNCVARRIGGLLSFHAPAENSDIAMDPRPIDQWSEIFGKLSAPNGESAELICANRVIGDLIGYIHPSGNNETRKRREGIRFRDANELKNAMIAFARMYFDAGVRP